MTVGLAEPATVTNQRVGFRDAARAEFRKLVTIRRWWLAVVGAAVLSLGSAVLAASVAGSGMRSHGAVLAVINGGNPLVRLLGFAVGVVATSGEYRFRTVVDTYLAVPRRSRVVLAKLVALALAGLLVGVLNQLIGLAVAAVTTGSDGRLYLDQSDTWRSVGLGAVSIVWWTWIGMGLGLLIRHMGWALLLGVVAAYLVEPTLATVALLRHWYVLLNLLPTGATNSMLEVESTMMLSSPQPWSWWAGLIVLATWSIVIAGIGSVLSIRRDV